MAGNEGVAASSEDATLHGTLILDADVRNWSIQSIIHAMSDC